MVIYTVGHSNQSLADFIGLLRENGINLLVDIRSAPYSKYVPHFSKKPLEKGMPEDISYAYMGDILGGKTRDPRLMTDDKVDYLKIQQQPWFLQGLHQLVEFSREYKLAIMCAEENPSSCHREKLVATSLRSKGEKVYHIRKTGVEKGNQSLDEFF